LPRHCEEREFRGTPSGGSHPKMDCRVACGASQ
jgi:hypothetical protein